MIEVKALSLLNKFEMKTRDYSTNSVFHEELVVTLIFFIFCIIKFEL